MPINPRTAILVAVAAVSIGCANRVRPTTYFVTVNQWDSLTDCILVTSIERGYGTRMSNLGIHVTRPPKGTPTRFTDINRPPQPSNNPLRLMKPGVDNKPVVIEEVFYERTIIPEGIVLKAQSRATDVTGGKVAGSSSTADRNRVAPSAHIQGAQKVLEQACLRNVQLYMGKPTGQVANERPNHPHAASSSGSGATRTPRGPSSPGESAARSAPSWGS